MANALDDFASSISPMAVKELRQGLRTKLFLGVFIGIQLLAVLALATEFLTGWNGSLSGWQDDEWLWQLFMPSPFWLLCEIAFLVLLPLGGFSALRSEMDKANIELLLIARLSRWRIVGGKWLMLCIQAWVIFASLLPYLVVRYFSGGVDLFPTIFLALCILGANATLNAVVIAASAFKNYLARIAMIAFLTMSAVWIVGNTAWAAYIVFEKFADPKDHQILYHGAVVLFAITACLVTTLLPLQIARGKLRLFERDYELSNTMAASILVVCIPIFLLIGGIATAGFGVPFILLGFAWCIKELDSPSSRPAPMSGTRVVS